MVKKGRRIRSLARSLGPAKGIIARKKARAPVPLRPSCVRCSVAAWPCRPGSQHGPTSASPGRGQRQPHARGTRSVHRGAGRQRARCARRVAGMRARGARERTLRKKFRSATPRRARARIPPASCRRLLWSCATTSAALSRGARCPPGSLSHCVRSHIHGVASCIGADSRRLQHVTHPSIPLSRAACPCCGLGLPSRSRVAAAGVCVP